MYLNLYFLPIPYTYCLLSLLSLSLFELVESRTELENKNRKIHAIGKQN